MKHLILIITLILSNLLLAIAQPTIQWQRSLGGSRPDNLRSVVRFGTGYAAIGSTDTLPPLNGYRSSTDVYFVRTNNAGQVVRQRAFGGNGVDVGNSIKVNPNRPNGFVIVGSTTTVSNGNVQSANRGGTDAWIALIDNDTLIKNERCTGGTAIDVFNQVIPTADGGFLAVGHSTSTTGTDIGTQVNRGLKDAMVVKFDSLLNMQWFRLFGGTNNDEATSVVADDSSGFVITGTTFSNDFNVSGNHAVGTSDVWVFRINSTGALTWQKCLGGTANEAGNDIKKLPTTEGYVIAATAASNNGDVTGFNGGASDGWLVKLNLSGVLQRAVCFGGNGGDVFNGIVRDSIDKGFVLVGAANSSNLLNIKAFNDAFVVKFDSLLNRKWYQLYGGTNDDDRAFQVIQTLDGGFAVAAHSNSNDGNVHFGSRVYNGWLIKLNRRNLSFYDDRQLIVRNFGTAVSLEATRIRYKARDVTPTTDTTCTNLRLWQIDTFPVIIGNDTLDDIIEVTNDIVGVPQVKTDPNYNSGVNDSLYTTDTIPRSMFNNCQETKDVLDTCTVTEKSKMQVAFIDSGLDGAPVSGKLKAEHSLFDRYIPTTNDSLGYDFVQNDLHPDDVNIYSHGTHVSGITERILTHYGLKNVRFMVLKTQAADGSGSLWNICRAIDYAVCRKVPIINMSLAYMADGVNLNGSVVKSLIDTPPASVGNFRSLFVVAAGNESINVDTQVVDVSCPVRFTSANMITVAAMKCGRDSAKFTNFGNISVDIATHGVNIWSTIRARKWGLLSGTSMATPVVTAAAVILGAQHSLASQFNALNVKNKIISARQGTSMFFDTTTVSRGSLNVCSARAAMTALQTLPITIAKVSPNPFLDNFTIEVADYTFNTPLSIGIYSVSGQLVHQHRLAPTFSTTATVNVTNLPMGLYVVKIQTADKLFTAKIVKSE